MSFRFIIAEVVLLASVVGVLAEPPAPVPPEHADQSGPTYGRAPEAVTPYRNFQEPYARFFQTRREFLGTGRDEPLLQDPRTARIGFFGPTGSAPDADLGQQMLEGVKLALEQANAAGGCDGKPFELIQRQDIGLWGAASNEAVAFKYEDNVLAIIGSIDGANTHVALRALLKLEMPMVNTASTDPTMTETNIPWLLRCIADDRQQGYALAHHVFQECGIEKVVAFRVNDRYGRTGIAKFRDAARRLGHPQSVELRWDRGERNFVVQLDRLAQTGADAVVLWGNAADSAAVVREIRKRNWISPATGKPVRIFGCDRLASRTFLDDAGDAAEGVVAVATYDPTSDDPRLRDFTAAFIDRFHHEPDAYAAHAFDGTNILIAAVRKAGLNPVRIRDALYEYTHYDGVTGPIEFDATLNNVGPVYLATVTDGRFVYRRADSTKTAHADDPKTPYRTLAESPPKARSPNREPSTPQDAYRVGCFLPLDEDGEAVVRGVQMAFTDDAARYPGATPIELLVRDARGAWGADSAALVDLVSSDEVLALIGSTERRGTHFAETLAAKLHFPIVTLCDTDPTITQIPLPWVFRIAPAPGEITPNFARRYTEHYGKQPTAYAALGYDAGAVTAAGIRSGAGSRLTLQNALAANAWHDGVTGRFRFDALGNRVDELEDGFRGDTAMAPGDSP